jgi:hypothetical protein
MKRIVAIQVMDEHNYIASSNWFHRENDTSYEVVCYKNAEILHPHFDVRHCVDALVDNNHQNHEHRISKAKALQDFASKLDFEFTLGGLKHKGPEGHVYKRTFSNLTKEMLGGNYFFKPRREDYLEIKEKISKYGNKVVAINGRDQFKNHGRNNLLGGEINLLLKAGYTVLNCTLPKPNLQINNPNYHEVGDDCIDYSRNISYFLCSKAVVSVGNAGAVTNHMSTQANVIMVGPGGWVDNPSFGYEGYSIFSAKQKIMGNAFKANLNNLCSIVENLQPPTDVLFFDEGSTHGGLVLMSPSDGLLDI